VNERQLELKRWEETYSNVMALYAALQDAGHFRVRRAELRQGEVKPEPLDFVVDVELKAVRTFKANPGDLVLWFLVLSAPESYEQLPQHLRQGLGRQFELNNLGVDGHYRLLYYRIKNRKERTVELEEETIG
jgi:hypothetical protein